MNEAWLAHHGIKGQKWGVRRYQNKDGSLTEAGKKHYSIAGEYTKKQSEIESNRAKAAKKNADRYSKDNPNRLKNIWDDYEYEEKYNPKDERLKRQLEEDADYEYSEAMNEYNQHISNAKQWAAASKRYTSMTKISDIDKRDIKNAKAFVKLYAQNRYF